MCAAPVVRKVIKRQLVEEDEELDLEQEELEQDDDDVDLEEDDDAEEDEAPAPKRVSKPAPAPAAKGKPAPVTKKVIKPVAEEDEEEAPAPVKSKPAAKPAPVVKKVTKPVEEEVDEDVPVKKVAAKAAPVVKPAEAHLADGLIMRILDALEAGKSITLTKMENGDFTVVDSKALKLKAKSGSAIKYADYEEMVMSDEYKAFREEWRNKSYEEKVKLAKKAGLEWKEAEDKNINLMRIMAAWTAANDIPKYKPEYADKAARKALRETGA